jgi:hypothetical protein
VIFLDVSALRRGAKPTPDVACALRLADRQCAGAQFGRKCLTLALMTPN